MHVSHLLSRPCISLLTGTYLHHGSLAHTKIAFPGIVLFETLEKRDEEDHHTLAVHAQRSGYTTLYAGKYLNQYRHYKDSTDTVSRGEFEILQLHDFRKGSQQQG